LPTTNFPITDKLNGKNYYANLLLYEVAVKLRQMAVRSTKTKEQIYRDAFQCLTNGAIPDDIFEGYMNDTDGEGTSRLQWWCVDNMKGWCMDWNTGIGIIEAVEHLYKVALENGNLSIDAEK